MFCLNCSGKYHFSRRCPKLIEVALDSKCSDEDKRKLQEKMDEFYVIKCSKKCPECMLPIQKQSGCNKMTCSRCSTYFCWKCG
jgi:hypothetical protein